jgi:hypothetical protein
VTRVLRCVRCRINNEKGLFDMRATLIPAALAVAVLGAAGSALAQSTGASPADPNNERNQQPAPSNTQPADPAASGNPAARVPTAPVDQRAAEREEGGATGTRLEGVPEPVAPN